MSDPDHTLHEAHVALAIAQERFAVALMREFSARGELHRSVVDHGREDIESGLHRLHLEAGTVDKAYAEVRDAREAWIALVKERRLERGIDLDAWLDRPYERDDQPEPDRDLGR